MKKIALTSFVLSLVAGISGLNAQTIINPTAVAGLTGTGTQDESTGVINLRDSNAGFPDGYSSDQYAYFRFSMDAANNTIAGIAVGDITAVSLNLYYTDWPGASESDLFVLNDAADLGGSFLTETNWSATGANELSGTIAPHGNLDVQNSTVASAIGTGNGLIPTVAGGGFFSISLNLAAFQAVVTGDTNNEFTLILDGAKDSTSAIASLANANTAWRPNLSITAIPEPSTFALLTVGLALVVTARRRRRV